jgi:hypothetical protein
VTPIAGLHSRFYSDWVKNTAGKAIISTALPTQRAFPLRSQTVSWYCLAWLAAGTDWTNIRIGIMSYAGTADSTVVTFLSGFGAGTNDASLAAQYSYCVPTFAYSGSFDSQGISATIGALPTLIGGTFTVPSTCHNLVPAVWSRDSLVGNSALFLAEPVLSPDQFPVWQPQDEELEYATCARYYQKTFAIDTAPAQNAGVNTGELRWTVPNAGATAIRSPFFTWPMRMRATPTTLTIYNPAAANAQVRDVTAAADCTASATAGSIDTGFYLTATGAAGTALGDHVAVHGSADAEIM